MALSAATKEAIWLKSLTAELDVKHGETSIKIYSDNQSALHLAKVDGFNQRTKHIDVRHHHIRDTVEQGIIELEYAPTDRMVADSLTKAVPGPKNKFCSNEMGLF